MQVPTTLRFPDRDYSGSQRIRNFYFCCHSRVHYKKKLYSL